MRASYRGEAATKGIRCGRADTCRIDSEQSQISVRQGKAAKRRTAIFPVGLVNPLESGYALVRRISELDLLEGHRENGNRDQIVPVAYPLAKEYEGYVAVVGKATFSRPVLLPDHFEMPSYPMDRCKFVLPSQENRTTLYVLDKPINEGAKQLAT